MPTRRGARRATAAIAWALALSAMLLVPTAAASGADRPAGTDHRATTPAKRADFNGDGFTDLAVGAPSGGVDFRGAVTIALGSAGGITGDHIDTLSPQTGGPNQSFGTAIASADFNHDGFADLAVGLPGQAVGGKTFAGQVVVLFGSAEGLRSDNPRTFTQNTPGIPGDPQQNAYFGATLAAGDFDGDGRSDLAIGAPLETVNAQSAAGAVFLLHGAQSGPTAPGAVMLTKDSPGIIGEVHHDAYFGFSLASGNLGKGAQADLAIGTVSDPVGSVGPSGSVTVLFGSATGLRGTGSQQWDAATAGQTGGAENAQGFGWSLAIGNVGKSGSSDLVIGSIGATVQGKSGAGAVFVLFGSRNGPVAAGARRITQATPGVPTDPEEFGQFGYALVVVDLDIDQPDMAISAPRMDSEPGADDDAGWLFLVPGGTSGLQPADTADFAGVDIAGQPSDSRLLAGAAMTVGQFGRGKAPDLALGIPGLKAGGNGGAGGAVILFGRAGGPDLAHLQRVDGDTITDFPSDVEARAGQSLVGSPRPVD